MARKNPVHRLAARPARLFGCPPELFLVAGCLGALLALASRRLVVGLGLSAALVVLGRTLSAIDPQLLAILARVRLQRRRYDPFKHHHA